jgi:RND family efflux transporter MFP subunit
MKSINFSVLAMLALSVLVVGCAQEEEQAAAEAVRPVKTLVIEAPDLGGVRQFPGRVDASRKVDLAFRVPGKVTELPVKEGDEVEQGQVLAQLDARDFELVVQDRQGEFDRAKKNFERASRLLKQNAIATMDYDRIESEFKTAEAALERAQRDVEYTTLKAPFEGNISRRLIENFQQVQAKQPVLELRDLSVLEVKFGVPEGIMLQIREVEQTGEDRSQIPIYATFEAAPGKRYDLTEKEVATSADPETQTFQATFVMPAPSDATVLPGMTASVTADLTQYLGSTDIYLLPVGAVTADNELEGTVWVVDEEAMTVASRTVKVGKMMGARIQVLEGVEPGDRVVVAGAPYLSEGMKVRLMPEIEQAEPRPDDLKLQNAASS